MPTSCATKTAPRSRRSRRPRRSLLSAVLVAGVLAGWAAPAAAKGPVSATVSVHGQDVPVGYATDDQVFSALLDDVHYWAAKGMGETGSSTVPAPDPALDLGQLVLVRFDQMELTVELYPWAAGGSALAHVAGGQEGFMEPTVDAWFPVSGRVHATLAAFGITRDGVDPDVERTGPPPADEEEVAADPVADDEAVADATGASDDAAPDPRPAADPGGDGGGDGVPVAVWLGVVAVVIGGLAVVLAGPLRHRVGHRDRPEPAPVGS